MFALLSQHVLPYIKVQWLEIGEAGSPLRFIAKPVKLPRHHAWTIYSPCGPVHRAVDPSRSLRWGLKCWGLVVRSSDFHVFFYEYQWELLAL